MTVAEGKGMPYIQPFGYNLALKKYPLRREIKYIIKEAHQGLGTGFLNYVSGDLGQLIVLKAGLIPLTRPITIRTYQISQ
jgi:phosphate transport system substrate-binding protein